MSFLEDIGKSNTLAATSKELMDEARQSRLDKAQAQQQSEQLAIQKEQLGMQKESHTVNLAVQQANLEKLRKEEAFNNQVFTVDQVFSSMPMLQNSPTAQKRLLDLAGPSLIDVNGVKGITRGDMMKIVQGMQVNTEFQKLLDEDVLRDHVSLKTQLVQQLQQVKNPKEAQAIQQQLAQNEQIISTILTTRAAMDKDAAKTAAEIKLLEARTKTEGAQAGYYGAKTAEVGLKKAGGTGGNTSFERAYAEFVANNPDQPMDRATFRQTKWLAQRDGAPLSDATAIENLKGLVDYDPEKFKVGYSEYVKLRKSGISSTEALDKVSQKLSKPQLAPMTDQTVPSHKPGGAVQKDFSSLWK